MENLRGALSLRLINNKVIAVLRAQLVSDLLPVCDVLVEENVLGLEFTLTTPDLTSQLPALQQRYAAHADVGVGTVTTVAEAERAIGQGAGYLVTPTMNLGRTRWTHAERAARRLVRRRRRREDLSCSDRRTGLRQTPAGTVPQPAGRAVRRRGHRERPRLMNAGALAVSLGGPLLGDALAGGPLGELRARCRSLREALR